MGITLSRTLFLIVLSAISLASAQTLDPVNQPALLGPTPQSGLYNNKIISKNQYMVSYASFGKNSYLLNSFQTSFSKNLSPVTVATFLISLNRVDSSLFFQDKNSLFPLYSFALETKKKGFSYGFSLGNTIPQERLSFTLENQGFSQLQSQKQYFSGYAEKSFLNGRVTLSIHGTTALPK